MARCSCGAAHRRMANYADLYGSMASVNSYATIRSDVTDQEVADLHCQLTPEVPVLLAFLTLCVLLAQERWGAALSLSWMALNIPALDCATLMAIPRHRHTEPHADNQLLIQHQGLSP